jgi:hypothetical protein
MPNMPPPQFVAPMADISHSDAVPDITSLWEQRPPEQSYSLT